MSKHQVFIFGYYGWKNVGDDAMLYALLQELHILNPKTEFAIPSSIPIIIPPETKSRVKFIKPSPLVVSREILKSSAFIIGGGTHLFDYGSKIRALLIQLRILTLILYSTLLRKKVYLLNNGLGPFSTAWGKFLAWLICYLADYISVRDEASYRFLTSWGFTSKSSLAFDTSALIEPLNENKGSAIKTGNKKILGISVTPVFEIYYNSREKDLLLINKIAEQINDWLKRDLQLEVYLFTFKGQSKDDDVLVAKLLQGQLRPLERIKLVSYDSDPRSLLAQIALCDAFVGMRYHSCLFAYLNSIPLLIVDYHPKCRALAKEIGLAEHAVISLEEVLNGQFGERLKNLMESPKNFCATLPVELARNRAREGVKIP